MQKSRAIVQLSCLKNMYKKPFNFNLLNFSDERRKTNFNSYLRNNFIFLSMNAMGYVQSKCTRHVKFARVHDPQKKLNSSLIFTAPL